MTDFDLIKPPPPLLLITLDDPSRILDWFELYLMKDLLF